MILLKTQTTYEVKDGENHAEIIVNNRLNTYEIYKRSIKSDEFLKSVENYAEILINKG